MTFLQGIAGWIPHRALSAEQMRCASQFERHGSLIQSEFKGLVDSQCPPSMCHTEVRYKVRIVVRYGYPGSSRADIVLGSQAKPIAVYDLKAGWGYISIGRANAYGRNLPYATPFTATYPKGL